MGAIIALFFVGIWARGQFWILRTILKVLGIVD